MRVLSIGLDGRVGFPEQRGYASMWVREMARLVDEYVVIAESPDGAPHGPTPLAENASAYLLPGSPLTYPWRAAALARTLHAATPFDIVTTEDPIRAGLAGAIFAAKTGVALNVENHSFHINEPDWISEKPHHRLYNRIAIHVVRRAGSIRSYSPGQNDVLRAIGVPEDRLFVVPACVPEMVFPTRAEARAHLGLSDDEPVIFSAGRMVPCKNLGVLLEAVALLRSHKAARLLLAGDGPSRSEWEARGVALGLGDAVRWLGQVPESEIPALHAAADVYATPSTRETGPRTVLEAYLAGRPVVVTADMGVTQMGVCEHNRSALVLDPHDARGWADALNELLSNPQRGERMAADGRARCAEEQSMPATARALMDVFRQTSAPGAAAIRAAARP